MVRYRETNLFSGFNRLNVVKNYCSTKKIKPFVSKADASYDTGWTANPGQQWYWVVYFDTSGTGEEVAINFDVEITYYCGIAKLDDVNES